MNVRSPASWTDTTAVFGASGFDSTTTPCHDFYQYATGGWYLGLPVRDRASLQIGPDQGRAGRALRQLVAQAPFLTSTTRDPVLQIVGHFYGSCLADTSGLALGVVGDTIRASYCFRTTRKHLDRALFELLMEYVWPPPARVESRRFWEHMQAGTAARITASQALQDSTKRQLLTLTNDIKPYLSRTSSDSATQLWRHDSPRPVGARGPSDVPFADRDVIATWIYRDYSNVVLSPVDFRHNVARLQAAPDLVPSPVLPLGEKERKEKQAPQLLLDVLLGNESYGADVASGMVALPLGMLVPPMVDDVLDLGAWYGMLGPLTGHEMSHGTLRGGGNTTPLTQISGSARAAFAIEQFQGQLEIFKHPFDDAFGVLIAYEAFQRAMQGRSKLTIDGLTAEQRFFFGVAWGFRGGPATLNTLFGATRWRVLTNGTLSAMPAFARAFGCKAGDPMAGGHVWYQDPWHGVIITSEQQEELSKEYERTLSGRMGAFGVPLSKLTAAQQEALANRRSVYAAHRQALLGGAGAGSATTPVASLQQINRFLMREVGEVRRVLTPEQQATFDVKAKDWMRQRRVEGDTVEIPGVQ